MYRRTTKRYHPAENQCAMQETLSFTISAGLLKIIFVSIQDIRFYCIAILSKCRHISSTYAVTAPFFVNLHLPFSPSTLSL